MNSRSWVAAAAVLAVFAAVVLEPVKADNPRITLELQEATFYQAAAALGRAAGVRIDLGSHDPADASRKADPPNLGAVYSFHWKEVRFAQALRELCKRYGLMPQRDEEGYVLVPGNQLPPFLPGRVLGVSEQDGVRVSVADVGTWMVTSLLNGKPDARRFLHLTLEVEWAAGDTQSIKRFDHLRLTDDLGNVFRGGGSMLIQRGGTPDHQTMTPIFPRIDERAKRIVSVEGDLLYQRLVRTFQVEVPVTGKAKHVEQEGTAVDIQPLDGRKPAGGPTSASGDRSLHARLFIPFHPGLQPTEENPGKLTLVTAAGKQYHADGSDILTTSSDGVTHEIEAKLPPMPEPPVKAVLHWTERSAPEKLTSFHFKDLPIQSGAEQQARRLPPFLEGSIRKTLESDRMQSNAFGG